MIHSGGRNLVRILVLGAAVAALGLSGCGRKGGLDAPPSASAAAEPQQGQQKAGLSPFGSSAASESQSQRSVYGERAGIGTDGRPVAPVGEKRRIPLDALID